MGTIADLIRDARKRLGFTQAELARRLNVTRGAVNHWETGATTPAPDKVKSLAETLAISPSALIGVDVGGSILMPVRGEVAGGVWLEPRNRTYAPIPVTPDPDYPAEAQYGLIVRGNSVNKFAQDGEYVHVVSVLDGAVTPRTGDLVVVERQDHDLAERTVKRLSRINGKVTLLPESTDPAFQDAIAFDDRPGAEVRIIAVVIGRYGKIPRGRG